MTYFCLIRTVYWIKIVFRNYLSSTWFRLKMASKIVFAIYLLVILVVVTSANEDGPVPEVDSLSNVEETEGKYLLQSMS